MARRQVSISLAVGAVLTVFEPARAKQPLTRIQQACLSWDLNLQRMLKWSEEYVIHPPELRNDRASRAKLRERCIRDVTPTTISRYVVLSKMLYDDEADEVESFDGCFADEEASFGNGDPARRGSRSYAISGALRWL
ncbi:MAG: hypothetical protein KME20_26740 [Kaiparowitsia implicata GSE-PSE-MK54-09C]|jgi:hypothetical protein|nr:hypothetical protein [Kaiparowitsia implicata GSE-PSE-MK54-09C]